MADPNARDIRFFRPLRPGNPARTQLAAIDGVAGVQGWMVGSHAGDVLFTSMPAPPDQERLDAIGHHVFHVASGMMEGDMATELEIAFSGGHLLARNIGKGWLIVFCQPRADLAMVRVTCSVTAAALSADRSFQNELTSPPRNVPLNAGFSSSPKAPRR